MPAGASEEERVLLGRWWSIETRKKVGKEYMFYQRTKERG